MSNWEGGYQPSYPNNSYSNPPPGFLQQHDGFNSDPHLGWFTPSEYPSSSFNGDFRSTSRSNYSRSREFIPTMVYQSSSNVSNGDWSDKSNLGNAGGNLPKPYQDQVPKPYPEQVPKPYQDQVSKPYQDQVPKPYQDHEEESYYRDLCNAVDDLYVEGPPPPPGLTRQFNSIYAPGGGYEQFNERGGGVYNQQRQDFRESRRDELPYYDRYLNDRPERPNYQQEPYNRGRKLRMENDGEFGWRQEDSMSSNMTPSMRSAVDNSFASQTYQRSNQTFRGGTSQRMGTDRLYRQPKNYSFGNQHPNNNNYNYNERSGPAGEEKSEGRRKLLEEAASLLTDQNVILNKPSESKMQRENSSWRNKEWFMKKEHKHWKQKQDSVCQRERLEEQLRKGTLECLVCCELIRHINKVWDCNNCHHILHLKCITKWAVTSKADNGWRCPACQNITSDIPSEYRCMCGKVKDPQLVRGETPHCCGQVCRKTTSCNHPCTLLCHPGPCPPCSANTSRKCGCGRTSQTVQCSSTLSIVCQSVCGKTLNCGVHKCNWKCHNSLCDPCAQILVQKCWCESQSRETLCDSTTKGATQYGCGGVCGKQLKCGHHSCNKECHPSDCGECPLSPTQVKTCPCGKSRESVLGRKSCLDEVKSCGEICGLERPPPCSHPCKSVCHPLPCPVCPLMTPLSCRCGRLQEEVPCAKLEEIGSHLICNKRCTKKRSCGKHKCNQNCCIDEEHICPLPCNKTLSCGRHKCQMLCHKGHCTPCSNVSFEELRCECGAEVILPPVPCGTRPPECKAPCPREHPCQHPPTHSCHSMPACPPCTILQAKHCHGKHELRKSVACHVGEFSCGLECGKKLECGHKCAAICHAGDCPLPCKRPCTAPRSSCPHPCNLPCHFPSPCPRPSPPCQALVRLTCPCSRRSAVRPCSDHTQRVATTLLAQSMQEVQLGRNVHPPDLSSSGKSSLKTLECNDDCKTYERNLRLAIGLQIVNPDLNSKLSPRYPDSMKTWAKRDPRLCQLVHEKLTQLVLLAKESKQKSRSYSFDPMNRDKRQFVHEYCKHFGCESVAYDTEPKRNVVATAYKDKCWLPSYSLLEMVQRENGQRKVPLPSLKKDLVKDAQMKPLQRVGPMTLISAQTTKPAEEPPHSPSPPAIDYFDYTN